MGTITDGKVETCKERFEEVDEESGKSLKVDIFEGDVKERYKSFKFIIKATDKEGDGGAIAKWSFLYEKILKGIPDPKGYSDMAATKIKVVDAYLLKHHYYRK
ncbi:hypothetical protein K1719_002802 [Acacia pycnantha]|nr:hypothetical protein K1719_002802 [Acacia pycnantha]